MDKSWLLTLASLVASLFATGAFGAEPVVPGGADLRWRCWYDAAPSPHVACRLVEAPAPDAAPVSLPVSVDRLPPMVRRIRTAPETLEGERIVIPLYSPPIDMRFVERLARAVMCGSRPACEVEFSAEPLDN